MNEALDKRISLRKRIWRILLAFVLLVILLPVFLKFFANRFVLPAKFADPDIPLTSGRIDRLGYTGLTAENLVVDAGNNIQFQIPKAKISYTPWSVLGKRFKSVTAGITSESTIKFEAEVSASNVHLSPAGISATISATCPRMTYGRYNAGPFTFSTQVEENAVALAFLAPLQDRLLNAQVSLEADWKSNTVFSARAIVPLTSNEGTAVDLSELMPGGDELLVSGQAEASVSFNSIGTDVILAMQCDSLALPEHELSVSNLNTVCNLQFSGPMRSLPEQRLTADRFAVGEMHFDQIMMHYQLEPGSVLFIEELDSNWCDGRVSLYSTRYSPGATNISTQLYCDRLSLEQVLASFGLEEFSASGQLNGRLPMRWSGQGLTIDRGFLFTTPGHGGTFAFDTEEAAATIIPPDSIQGGQLGLVSTALADFEYDWITMTFNSEGENLRVVVEIDGQPVNVLPYEYDSEQGTYVRIALRPGRGTRQPMHFRLNLTVPLNKLFCYASGINRQWHRFKDNQ